MEQLQEQRKYMVVRPGKDVHEFDNSKDAIAQLVKSQGFTKVYDPNGNLLLTKGAPQGSN